MRQPQFGASRRRAYLVFAALILLLAGPGCNHLALQRRTVNQASTLLDLQYKQVLDNLAMFACNHDALPSQVRLNGGLVQVTDQGAASISGIAGGTGDMANSLTPTFGGQRTVVGQWDVDPVIDANDLDLLRLAYVKEVEFDTVKRKKLKQKIRQQIWSLALAYEFNIRAKVLLELMKDGLEDGFKRSIFDKLDKVPQDDLSYSDCRMAYDCMMRAQDCLKTAIDKQYYKRSKRKRSENSELEFLSQFQGYASVALAHLERSSYENVDAVRETIEYLKDFPRGTDTPAENLPLLVAHLNPVISNDLEDKREKRELCAFQAMDPHCKPPKFKWRYEKLYEPNVNFLFYVDAGPDFLVAQTGRKTQDRNPGLADQAMDKVTELRTLLDDIEAQEQDQSQEPWFGCGAKCDVPKCACYVGHYCGCGCDCYVWVMPEHMKEFREFTIRVLNLAPTESQDAFTSMGRGAAFSPGH
jgi:hypothetical protein